MTTPKVTPITTPLLDSELYSIGLVSLLSIFLNTKLPLLF